MPRKKKLLVELVRDKTWEARRPHHANLLLIGELLETPLLADLQELIRESRDPLERQQLLRQFERLVKDGIGAREGEGVLGFMETTWAMSGPYPGWVDPAPLTFGELCDQWARWNRRHGRRWRALHGCLRPGENAPKRMGGKPPPDPPGFELLAALPAAQRW